MQVITHPDRNEWVALLQRPMIDNSQLLATVGAIMQNVRASGDRALREYAFQFDGVILNDLSVSAPEIDNAGKGLDETLKTAIQQAAKNIETFHRSQLSEPQVIETMPGVKCWRKSVGIERVGLYIPGGTAPLFSTVLMLGIPAKLAGCKEVILCTPTDKKGAVHPAVLYAAQLVGISKIYKTGGAQAIAAMAYGTETVPAVYKIFGPGNQYVTAAKQIAQQEGIAIDMPAGPSEVCVLADGNANPEFIAADLLSQAEHGTDSQVLLVSTDTGIVNLVNEALQKQVETLPRQAVAEKALANSKAIIAKTGEQAIAIINEYAAEHLILNCNDADTIAEKIQAAGSIFIGAYSPESVGDYASGTNHTLPTNGFARVYSGVSVDSFVKKITYQKLTKEGIENIGRTVMTMAKAEGLEAHALAVEVRLAGTK
jgi:histidinol dehydrogenase